MSHSEWHGDAVKDNIISIDFKNRKKASTEEHLNLSQMSREQVQKIFAEDFGRSRNQDSRPVPVEASPDEASVERMQRMFDALCDSALGEILDASPARSHASRRMGRDEAVDNAFGQKRKASGQTKPKAESVPPPVLLPLNDGDYIHPGFVVALSSKYRLPRQLSRPASFDWVGTNAPPESMTLSGTKFYFCGVDWHNIEETSGDVIKVLKAKYAACRRNAI